MNYAPLNTNAVQFKFLQTVLITWRSRERVRRKNTIVTEFVIMKWCVVIYLKEYSFRSGNIYVECKITRMALVHIFLSFRFVDCNVCTIDVRRVEFCVEMNGKRTSTLCVRYCM